MPRRIVSPTLVGRTRELSVIDGALEATLAGRPLHLLVGGEAGVGKSRLAREAAARAAERGFLVLAGGCANIGDGGLPYGPIVEILRSLVRQLDPAPLDEVVGSARQDLARLLPALSPQPLPDDAGPTESLQPRLLDALLGLLARLARRQPALLIVEDLHWADPASRETIAFLARSLQSERAMLLLTFRSDELHRRHPLLPWLAELDRSGHVERIDLTRLDDRETHDLVAAILGGDPDPELADQVARRSDGNPFFVEELLGAREEVSPGRLPPTLREVLLARLVALPDSAQAVIGVAAVAGRAIDHELLAQVAPMPEDALLDGLRLAVSSQVLETQASGSAHGSDYTFRHALLQEAAYDDLLPGERIRLHRAFAEALAARGAGGGAMAAGHWAELAYHWSAARDDRRAFEAFVRAGEEAARTFAFADAWRHDERALELWTKVEDPVGIAGIDQVALLDRASLAAWLAGDSRRSVSLRREAIARLGPGADPVRRGVLLERLGRALWYNGQTEAALASHEQAVQVIPAEPPSAERARVLSGYGQLLMLVDQPEASIRVCEEAVGIARRVGARQAEGHALNTLGLDLAITGRGDDGIAALRESLRIARDLANADDIGRAYVNLSDAYMYAGDWRGAADVVREGVAVAAEVGITGTYGRFVRENGIAASFELGDWDEASRLADESAAIAQRGPQQVRYALAHWVCLLVGRGDPRAAMILETLRQLTEGLPPEAQFNLPMRIAEADAALLRSDPATALTAVQAGIREMESHGWHWLQPRLYRYGLRATADLAAIGRAGRDRAGEAAAIETGEALWAAAQPILEAARARQHGSDAELTAAEVATMDAERRRLADASGGGPVWGLVAATWEARGNAYPAAYCRWREAEELLATGDRPGATRALTAAGRLASALGAAPLLETLGALAARARLDVAESEPTMPKPSAPTPGDQFGLTRRERDVLAQLVQGRTNRQIAEALFISENTAGVHVSNIIGKMGATSRTEAAAIAARLGLGVE